MLEGFGPEALRPWAKGLGDETFQATSRRVYPNSLKAAPLLLSWVDRLRSQGVRFAMNHRWNSLRSDSDLLFEFAGILPSSPKPWLWSWVATPGAAPAATGLGCPCWNPSG